MPDNGSSPSDWLKAWLEALFASGWYTPEAVQQATNIPLRLDPAQSAAGYYGGPRSSQPGISLRDTFPSVALHEYNHYFDYLNSIVSNPALRALVLENLMGTQIPFTEAVQRYRGGLSSAMQQFPGMYGNPKSRLIDKNTGQVIGLWGGAGEMYARLGEQPWKIPPIMRQYYPQFAARAYQGPVGRRVVFEDGSVGYEANPYPTLPSVPSGVSPTALAVPGSLPGRQGTLAAEVVAQGSRPSTRAAPVFKPETRPAPPGAKPAAMLTKRSSIPPPPSGREAKRGKVLLSRR